MTTRNSWLPQSSGMFLHWDHLVAETRPPKSDVANLAEGMAEDQVKGAAASPHHQLGLQLCELSLPRVCGVLQMQ
eukprot:8936534-Karenia_brevis.AAC.1